MDYILEDNSSKGLKRLSGEELSPEGPCSAEEEEEDEARETEVSVYKGGFIRQPHLERLVFRMADG